MIKSSQCDIFGFLQIKRKRFWVIRYAEIQNGYFFYFLNKGIFKNKNIKNNRSNKFVFQTTFFFFSLNTFVYILTSFFVLIIIFLSKKKKKKNVTKLKLKLIIVINDFNNNIGDIEPRGAYQLSKCEIKE